MEMMDKSYKNTYLITGASSGIGREIAKRLAGPDTLLVLVSRKTDIIEEYTSSLDGDVIPFSCDLCNKNDISALFMFLKERGIKLSGMVYSAGIYDLKPIRNMQDGEIERVFQVNTFGFYNICRYLQSSQFMINGGSIVAISSYSSLLKEKGLSAYAASKTALNTLVEITSKEFIKRSIRVNAVLPGRTTSKMGSFSDEWSEEELCEREKNQPLGLIPVSEVVDSVLFLLSDSNAHITGELLSISGGYYSGS